MDGNERACFADFYFFPPACKPKNICVHSRPFAALVACWLVFLLSPLFGLAQEQRFDWASRTRAMVIGGGHSWTPGFGQTKSNIVFTAFHPQMGWFVADHLELYGEATLFVYHKPAPAVGAGLAGIAGRYYFSNRRPWTPYATAGAGLLWTNLAVREVDRVFNFQLFVGAGLRQVPRKGPGWIFEFRNHHISNADTAGRNFGINAATLLVGWGWILR